MNTLRFLPAIAVILGPIAARADLVSSAFVAFGDGELNAASQFGVQTAQVSNGYNSPGFFLGSAQAIATYGRVAGHASAIASQAAFDVNVAVAEARFSDLITITGGSGSGFIIYDYAVFGEASGDEADAHLFLHHGEEPDEELAGEVTEFGVFSSVPRAFSFGVPVRTGLTFHCQAALGLGESGEAFSDFSFGAYLAAVHIYDSEMQPIETFTVSALSGTQYPLPAPATAALFPAAAALFLRRRR